jgi:hypothetical protein
MGSQRGGVTMAAADRAERRGLKDGNDRVPTIARWLSQKLPKHVDAHELVLSAWTADDEPEVLARYAKEDVSPELAIDLSALISDYADDAGQHCKAQLAWVSGDDRPLVSKRFRGLCRKESQVTVQPLDGTNGSVINQLQRFCESIFETSMRERQAADARIERMFQLMDRQLERTHERLTVAETAADEAAATAEEATEMAEEAASAAEQALERAEAQKGEDRVAQVIELVTKQITAG